MHGRDLELASLIRFLAEPSRRPRAVVVLGDAGSGKSLMLEALFASAGDPACELFDDVDQPGVRRRVLERLDHLANSLATAPCRLLLAGRELHPDLRDRIDRLTDRRMLVLGALDDRAAIQLLRASDIPRWSMRAAVILRAADGNPRRLIDGATRPVAIDWSEDRTFERLAEHPSLHDWHQALESCDERRRAEALERSDPTGADGLLVRAEEHLLTGSLVDAIAEAERSGAIARHADDRWLANRATSTAAYSRGLLGDPLGIESLHGLIIEAEAAGWGDLVTSCWHRIHNLHFAAGRIDLSRAACERAITAADEHHLLGRGLAMRMCMGFQLLIEGEEEAAIQQLREVVEIAPSTTWALVLATASQELARVLLQRGELGEARMLAEEALARLPGREHALHHVGMRIIAARARAASGDRDGAMRALGTAEECMAGMREGGQLFYVALEAVRTLARTGGTGASMAPWAQVLEATPEVVVGGDVDAAIAEANGWRLAAEEDLSAALAELRRATKLWEECSCTDEVEALQNLRDSLGLERRVTDVFDALTRREREIAHLAAGGHTNAEIAAKLFLSVRTVEHHVARVLRKLELPNRRALAQAAVDRSLTPV